MRVLLVEDDALIRELVVEVLRDEGFQVMQAAGGEEAVELCQRNKANVLLTDIRLPGPIDGWDIAERCRAISSDLHVIYATGYSSVAHRPVEGSVTLQKPFHPQDGVRAIRRLTQGSRRQTT